MHQNGQTFVGVQNVCRLIQLRPLEFHAWEICPNTFEATCAQHRARILVPVITGDTVYRSTLQATRHNQIQGMSEIDVSRSCRYFAATD